MSPKDYRSKITDLFLNSVVDLVMLADQAKSTETIQLDKMRTKVSNTIGNMLADYMGDYIESVVMQMDDQNKMMGLDQLATIDDDDDERTLH